MPRTKKIIHKKESLQTPTAQVAYLENCIRDCQDKLAIAFKKAISTTKKQQDQLKNKLTKAKQKLSTTKTKAKIVTAKSKGKSRAKTTPSKSDLGKTTIKEAQQAIKHIELELLKNKHDLVDLQQNEKKFYAVQKAISQFQKQWESKTHKAPKAPKAPKIKTTAKKKNSKAKENASKLIPEIVPLNKENSEISPEETFSEFRFIAISEDNSLSEK